LFEAREEETMNLVGKIFTVLIIVLSLVFMTLAVLVYSTHKNWRTVVLNDKAAVAKPLGLVYQLKDLQNQKTNLSDELDKVKRERAKETAEKDDRLARADNEIAELKQDRIQREREKATLTDDLRKAVGAMNAAQAESSKYSKEALELRRDLEMAQRDRRLHEKEVNRLADQDEQLRDELKTINDRHLILAADLSKAQTVLRHFGMNKDTDISGTPPPQLTGIVEAVPGKGLVEINLGADDGLMKGHKLQVVRVGSPSKYVGQIEVVKVAADRSVCRIDPRYQKSDMQVDDRVFSKLE
jgi:hypothetical protein